MQFLTLLCTEVLAPLIVGSQKQFNFSHITAGATAMGKVTFPVNYMEKEKTAHNYNVLHWLVCNRDGNLILTALAIG